MQSYLKLRNNIAYFFHLLIPSPMSNLQFHETVVIVNDLDMVSFVEWTQLLKEKIRKSERNAVLDFIILI